MFSSCCEAAQTLFPMAVAQPAVRFRDLGTCRLSSRVQVPDAVCRPGTVCHDPH